jgi:hypothetical protein
MGVSLICHSEVMVGGAFIEMAVQTASVPPVTGFAA